MFVFLEMRYHNSSSFFFSFFKDVDVYISLFFVGLTIFYVMNIFSHFVTFLSLSLSLSLALSLSLFVCARVFCVRFVCVCVCVYVCVCVCVCVRARVLGLCGYGANSAEGGIEKAYFRRS